jgi:hypothetical protein
MTGTLSAAPAALVSGPNPRLGMLVEPEHDCPLVDVPKIGLAPLDLMVVAMKSRSDWKRAVPTCRLQWRPPASLMPNATYTQSPGCIPFVGSSMVVKLSE